MFFLGIEIALSQFKTRYFFPLRQKNYRLPLCQFIKIFERSPESHSPFSHFLSSEDNGSPVSFQTLPSPQM